MKIGIVGAGNIGGSLGKLWAAKGHKIVFGVRDVNSAKTQKALAEIGDVRAVSIAEAVAWCDVVVLAVPWGAAQETVEAMVVFAIRGIGGRGRVICFPEISCR